MKVTPLAIPDVLLIEPDVFGDARGHFFESYNTRSYSDAIRPGITFVQDNQSRSAKGVLRGLHYQLPPKAQGKLLRVAAGEIFDVAVDIRRGSQTFGKWVGEHLSADNRKQMWLPEGFAHGFLVLSEFADLLYKTTDYYAPELEHSIAWNDPALAIAWPTSETPTLSARDATASAFKTADLFD